MVYLDEILTSKVALVKTSLDLPNLTFLHGHPIEIIEELKERSQAQTTKAQRFPLVALFRDFPERKGREVGIESEVDITIIIATRTEPTYKSEKRKEVSFKAVLHPIWKALEQEFMWAKEFNADGTGLDYTLIDHYFWGREGLYGSEGNIFTDFIDCVEIRLNNLKIRTKNC